MKRIALVMAFITVTGFCLGCGSIGGGKGSTKDRLKIELRIPSEEDPEVFWSDVNVKKLQIQGRNSQEMLWTTGSIIELETDAGDSLSFRGYDDQGTLLVSGQAEVSEEKTVTIPVVKVL
jgi:hypothetical protein